ncbi:hypothetical protein [Nocardioides houyundeii]|uniref:hypothetical protein n=1 Tax=Nocardioides houyundeii TaxID=2045452 RepID=UPI0013157C5E|nr:hypothetical protein [Nocardioides houyundeii]
MTLPSACGSIEGDVFPLDELDAAGVLERAECALVARRSVEVEDLRLVAQWALLHGSDPRDDPGASGWDRLVDIGGEGTPRVRDLCLGELAVVRRVHGLSVRSAMADVLDLQWRLPRTWAVVLGLGCEPWLARRVASLSRRLGLVEVGVVDAAVAACIGGEAPARVLEVAEAAVIAADPAGHAARVEEQRRRRFVSLSRTDEHGLRHLVARVEAGDAVYVEAMVARVAEILATQHAQTANHSADQAAAQTGTAGAAPRPSRDELRAEALGWLARPAELLQLLLEHTTPDQPDQPDQPTEPTDPQDPAEPTDPQDAADPQDGPVLSRALAFPADLLTALRSIDPTRLRPAAVLYLHLTDHTLTHPETGVARVEGHGPVLATQLTGWLTHTHLTVKPVIDLAETITTTAYEHSPGLKERIRLLVGARDTFPYATGGSRRLDHDHPTPYRHGAPPGHPPQTGTHNSAPLSRRHHQWKTHAGFHSRQIAPATYAWTTPHGHHYLVGPHGTRPLTNHQGQRYHHATTAELHLINHHLAPT